MTSAFAQPPAITLGADPSWRVTRARKVVASVADGGSDGRLSGDEAAKILGTDRVAVWRIPREELPYVEHGGGPRRKGRRRYLPEDVERQRLRMTGALPTWAQEIKAQVADHDARLAEVERRLLERDRPPTD